MAACHADYPTFVPNLGEKGKAVLIKVVLLGCCGVGKTKILERLSLDPIDRGINAQMSVAPSFSYYRMTVDVFKTDFPVIFQVWDTAGNPKFSDLSGLTGAMKSADGVLLVCDVTDASTARNTLTYMRRNFLNYRKLASDVDFPMVVMANKCDLDDQRVVKEMDIKEWCEDNLQCNGKYVQNWAAAFPQDRRLPQCFFSTRVIDRLEEPACQIKESLFCLARHVIIRWATTTESGGGGTGAEAAQAAAQALGTSQALLVAGAEQAEKVVITGAEIAENQANAALSLADGSAQSARTGKLLVAKAANPGDGGLSAPRGENLSARPV